MATALLRPLELPPYELKCLIPHPAFDAPISTAKSPISSAADKQQTKGNRKPPDVRGVQATASNIYVPNSEGSVGLWKLAANADKETEEDLPCRLLHTFDVIPTQKSIDKFAILPSVEKALVLSEGVLTICALTSGGNGLAPLPAFQPLKNISTFAIDESTYGDDSDAVMVCVLRRRGPQLFRIAIDSIESIAEVKVQNSGHLAVLRGQNLYIADSFFYTLISLVDSSAVQMLPISQDPPPTPPALQTPKPHQRPSIVAIDDDEFLLASHSGDTTLGMFLKTSGEPTRGTVEWASNPKSILLDHPYIVALLRNNTIEVHSLYTQEIVQVISLSEVVSPRSLWSTATQAPPLHYPLIGAHDKLRQALFQLRPEPSFTPSTSPRTPTRPSLKPRKRLYHSLASDSVEARTLLHAQSSVYSLLPMTLIKQCDALFDSNRLEEALKLADQSIAEADRSQSRDYHYIQQRAALQLIKETRFHHAIPYLQNSHIDARAIIQVFPRYMAAINPGDECQIFAGLTSLLEVCSSVDDIIRNNLVRNYSPHVEPSSPHARKLGDKLLLDAQEMLRAYLEHVREKRSPRKKPKTHRVVDVALVKLLLDLKRLDDVEHLLRTGHYCEAEDIVEDLQDAGMHAAAAMLYLGEGEHSKVLAIWTELLEGKRTDPKFQGTKEDVYTLLASSSNQDLVIRYTLWLVKHDLQLSLQLLSKIHENIQVDNAQLLKQLEAIDHIAANHFLEILVLRGEDKAANHNANLISRYLEQLSTALRDNEAKAELRELQTQYCQSEASSTRSYLSYSYTRPNLSQVQKLRLKLILFVHLTEQFDFNGTKEKLETMPLLVLERVVIYGKLGLHRQALQLLTQTSLSDFIGAEAYCTLGGSLCTAIVAKKIAKKVGLDLPASLLEQGSFSQHVSEEKKRELLGILISVYFEKMNDKSAPASITQKTQNLLASQGAHLSVDSLIPTLPEDWTLHDTASLFTRSFRRSAHTKHEATLIKAIASGQNARVSLALWERQRKIGPTVVTEDMLGGDEVETIDKIELEKDDRDPLGVHEIR